MTWLRLVTRSLACLLAAMALASASAIAAPTGAAYPARPVSIIVPYPPGGTADLVARQLSAGLQDTLGVPVMLQYKPGAGGMIGTRAAARSAADGYTLILVLAAHAIQPSLNRPLAYDPVRDFTPIALVATSPLVLYTRTDWPVTTVAELLARARQRPLSVTVASSGVGNTSHLAMELLSEVAGVRMTHIPYQGGSQAAAAVMRGDVDALFAGPDTGQMAAERLRPLAVTRPTTLASLAGTPTFDAAGLPGMGIEGWYGLLAPAGTPPAIVRTLARAAQRAQADAGFRDTLSRFGFSTVQSDPARFQAFILRETRRWKGLVAGRRLDGEAQEALSAR